MENLPFAMSWFLPVILVLALWEGVWKVIAMWRSARNNHLGWFVAIAIFNTVGILPIIYLLTNKPNQNTQITDYKS